MTVRRSPRSSYRGGDRCAASGTEILEAFEDYKAELAKSIDRADEGRDFWMAKSAGGDGKILRNVRPPKGYAGQRDADLSTLEELSKSLTADQVSAMAGQLASLRERGREGLGLAVPGDRHADRTTRSWPRSTLRPRRS